MAFTVLLVFAFFEAENHLPSFLLENFKFSVPRTNKFMHITKKKNVFVSKILPKIIKQELSILGFESISISGSDKISGELAYHPDLRMLKLPNGNWLTDNYEQIVNCGRAVNLINYRDLQNSVKGGYPQECALNCFFAGNKLFGGSVIAEELLEFVKCNGFNHVICRQGYTKCSTAKLNEDAFITSDVGIFSALTANGFDALKVSNDGIILNGYSCGFFGGCSGRLGEELLVFTGKIENHVDYRNIKSFCSNYGVTPYSLCEEALYDYGGILEV